MDVFIATLGMTFAAFVVWLTVRIVNRRERWAKRTARALVVMLVLNVASLGPALWIFAKLGKPEWLRDILRFVFISVVSAERYGPGWLKEMIRAYGNWWS